jgi:hypothetical protein
LAQQFIDNIWKLHGLLTRTVSDPQFTAAFTTEFYHLLGIKAAKTTVYHPQADGQTEQVNQKLEQYLWLFISERQKNWMDLLHGGVPVQQPCPLLHSANTLLPQLWTTPPNGF